MEKKPIPMPLGFKVEVKFLAAEQVSKNNVCSTMVFEREGKSCYCVWSGDYTGKGPCRGYLVRKTDVPGEWIVAKGELVEKYLQEVNFWVKKAVQIVTGKADVEVDYSCGQTLFSNERKYKRCYEILNEKLGFPLEWMGLSKMDYALMIYERNGIFNEI